MPPRKPVKMNLNAFHKGHSAEGEGDLPLGPSGVPDERGGGRWEEDRPPRDRPSRDDDGPSRADDGEWRQSGGRRGGGFRSGGGDFGGDRGRDGGFRSGGDRGGDRGGFGGDRGGFGDRGGDRGGFGGDRGGSGDRGGDRGGFGDRDRGSFGDRERGGLGSDRGGFGGDRGGDSRGGRSGFGGGFSGGGDREGSDRWRREGGREGGGREEGGSGWRESGREGGFGADRGGDRGGFDRRGGEGGFREGGGSFRGGDRPPASRFGDRRGESGDVRASSGDVRSEYRPLQLKKKGEAVDGPVEPARRSEIFAGRDTPRETTRGDARGDAVVIHKSTRADRGGDRDRDRDTRGDESDKEQPSKPTKSSREEPERSSKEVEKSVLERALAEKQTVSVADLTEGLENLKLTADNRSQFSEVIAKSLFLNQLTLKEAVEALQEKVPSDAPSTVLGVLQFLKSKKGEEAVLAMIEHSKLDILQVIAKDRSTDALQKLLTDSSLLCLMPVSALDQHVTKLLSEGKQSPEAVLEYINKNAEAKQSVGSLGTPVGNRVGQLVFQDPSKPDLEAITQFSKLLRRVVSQPKNDPKAMAAFLFGIQKAWSDAKMPKGALKPLFEKLFQSKLVTWEGFDAWKEDSNNKTHNKPKALVQVFSFLDSIKPTEVEEEDEGEDEGDEEEP